MKDLTADFFISLYTLLNDFTLFHPGKPYHEDFYDLNPR